MREPTTRIEMLPARDPEPLRIETGHVQRAGDRVGVVELTTTALLTRDQLEAEIARLRARLASCTCNA